jgi:DNA helicase IV
MEKYKQKLLDEVHAHIDVVRKVIRVKLEQVKILANTTLLEISKMPTSDQAVYMNLQATAEDRVVELEHLNSSPYFIKCQIIDEEGKEKNYFFAKHEFSEESIYSWIAPVASIRFESPGPASYMLPNGRTKTVTIKQKEQYMIVGGKVIFFALENEQTPRALIYQEHFTQQKSEFALPEIVAQMEKAQDQVIRADYRGPMSISGPAGSGKTTLALHRVAYLTQAPDSAALYPPRSIIVFVQDTGTKEYFSTLLPGLGIHDVLITTFSEWAFSILSIEGCSYVERYGESEEEKDIYEYQKLRALREGTLSSWDKNPYTVLNTQYEKYFSSANLKLFAKQKKEKQLDRFDLVILLKSHLEKFSHFETKREYQTYVKDKLTRKIEKTPILYSLMIVDEFQNYLPEQLSIFRGCLDTQTKSAVYVGDIAQQVKLGTIKNWDEAGEVILPERNIRLNKVYRNTKNILLYIQTLGYAVEIPEGLKEGPPITEKVIETTEDEINHIKENIHTYEKGSVGILAKSESYLASFKKEFADVKNVHVLTMIESQGVEFDIVFIVGVNRQAFEVSQHIDVLPEHLKERKQMQKDLVYVALTRAINELHILGQDRLRETFD